MTSVYLVRHGRRAAGAGDPGLSAEGRVDAEQTARVLAEEPIAAVYTSPLRRATETARILAQPHGLAVTATPLLRERANFGDLPGQTREEFDLIWARCSRDRDFVPSGSDSSREAGRRVERWLAGLEPGSVALAVTHGGVLADFLLNVCGPDELASANAAFAQRPYDGEVVRQCSITLVRCEASAITPVRIAASGHL